ncbi:hypothetical protein NS226_21075 [Aureimonas ureilytica]|uniref:YcfA family protein n=1 Tax=Aureimonas ureilytica TaxID=401562 RepID=A0A175R3J7_9HYPH|nr:hypothetical protein [Aureimonas ureilytica]KTQ85088.1 hypothetical protein NS226_21075 [Aureimonas ureilytica]
MKREALIRELRKRARKEGVQFDWDPSSGKGGHGVLTYGSRRTIVKSGELHPTYVALIKGQLGIE